MIGEGRLEALRRGVPGALYMSVLVAVLWAGAGGAALAQFPDNRDLKLDPEDSVPPFYRGTLDERDSQRLDAARKAGETYLPTFQGPSTAPAAAATRAPERPQPVYEGYRRPERRAEQAPAGDTRAGDPRPAGAHIDVLIEAWTRQPGNRPRALPRSVRPRSGLGVRRGQSRTTFRPGHSCRRPSGERTASAARPCRDRALRPHHVRRGLGLPGPGAA